MKIQKIIILSVFLVVFICIFGVISAQTTKHTLQDYGLPKGAEKTLTPEQIKEILNSPTPAERQAELKAQIDGAENTSKEKIQLEADAGLYQPETPEGAVKCFDYYHFQSVQTNLTTQEFNFKPGETINFSGPITNQNDYPIVNGSLYVKIFRDRGTMKDNNGSDVVDQFVAVDNISIPAKGETNVSFSWKAPLSSVLGNYKLISFFIVDKKFNLLGLSFTDDIVGSTFSFQIGDENQNVKNVQFDKAGVKVNGEPYFFASFMPRVDFKDAAVISAKIDNSTNKDETTDIVWKIYRWDSMNPENLIKTVDEKVSVKANSSALASVSVSEVGYPVYYIIGELKYKDSKSIIGVRFVRPGFDRLKINFPAVINFPIKKGSSSTLFSCIYHSGDYSYTDPDGKLVLKLTDVQGNIIEEYTYNGPIIGMMGLKKDFVSKKTYDHFFLSAELFKSDELLEKSILEYDCNKIDPKTCESESSAAIIFYIITGMIILLVIVGIISMIFLRIKSINNI